MAGWKLLIGGQFVDGAGGTLDVINPATERPVAQCPLADAEQIDKAVAAAKAAFGAWSRTPVAARARLVEKIADALLERQDEIARLITAEQGKPLKSALAEVTVAAMTLRDFAPMKAETRVLRETPEERIIETRTPLGVVVAITPWNYPLLMLMNKFAPAILTGNTLVAKPAPTTPLTAVLFARIVADILPAGVFNLVCDNNDLGDVLTGHPDVAKVSFTGSTVTGRKVMASAAATIKRVTMELGGNDPAIILDDADPVETAQHVFKSAMSNAGQVCVAIKRAYVPQPMYNEFCAELARLANAVIVDDGEKQGTQMGPVQNRAQFEKLKGYLADARERGTIIAGGEPLDRPGFFIAPTIVRDIADDARLVREEQFGPILPVLAYTDIDDAIARANDSALGLGGSVWGGNLDRAVEVANRIDSGTVWVNRHLAIATDIPFRGAKQSGVGSDLGEEGMLEYTQPHVISIALT